MGIDTSGCDLNPFRVRLVRSKGGPPDLEIVAARFISEAVAARSGAATIAARDAEIASEKQAPILLSTLRAQYGDDAFWLDRLTREAVELLRLKAETDATGAK